MLLKAASGRLLVLSAKIVRQWYANQIDDATLMSLLRPVHVIKLC